jgi:hypothetical protein
MSVLDGLATAFFGVDRAIRLSPLAEATMSATLAEDLARQKVGAKAQAAYDGIWPAPLQPGDDGVDDTVTVNRVRRVVDIGTAFLFGDPPVWNLGDQTAAPETETPDEVWLAECWRVNDGHAQALDWRNTGGVHGTAFLRVYPPVNPNAPATEPAHYPTFEVMDPACMTLVWHPRNIRDITGYIWQYNAGKLTYRQRILRNEGGLSWQIIDEHKDVQSIDDAWIPDGEAVWPYRWAPVLHHKNMPAANSVYGAPDVTEGLISLNTGLNRNLSNAARVLRLQGHPILYGTGVGGGDLEIKPGAFNWLPIDGKLDQLAPQLNYDAAADHGRRLDEAICEDSATPAVTLGRDTQAHAGNPSGVALRIKFWPMTQRLSVLRTLYGPALVELIRRLMELGGKGADRIVTLNWPEVLPKDLLLEAQALQIYYNMGLGSRGTMAGQVGFDWPTEQKNLKAEVKLPRPIPSPGLASAVQEEMTQMQPQEEEKPA